MRWLLFTIGIAKSGSTVYLATVDSRSSLFVVVFNDYRHLPSTKKLNVKVEKHFDLFQNYCSFIFHYVGTKNPEIGWKEFSSVFNEYSNGLMAEHASKSKLSTQEIKFDPISK